MLTPPSAEVSAQPPDHGGLPGDPLAAWPAGPVVGGQGGVEVSTLLDRLGNEASDGHAVLHSGGDALPHGGEESMRGVADDDDSTARVARHPMRQVVNVVGSLTRFSGLMG